MNFYSTVLKRVGIAAAIMIILSVILLIAWNSLYLYDSLNTPGFFQKQGYTFDRFWKPVYVSCLEYERRGFEV